MEEKPSPFPKAKQAAFAAAAVAISLALVGILGAVIVSAPAWYERFQAFRHEQRQAEAMHGRVRVLDCIDAAKERLQKPIPRDTLAGIEAACAVADANR